MAKPDIYVPRSSRVYTKRNPFWRGAEAALGLFNIIGGGLFTLAEGPGFGVVAIGFGIGCLIDASIKHRRLR